MNFTAWRQAIKKATARTNFTGLDKSDLTTFWAILGIISDTCMTEFFNDIFFLIQRFGWTDLLDIILVTVIFYAVLILLRDTEALILLRGVLFIIILLGLLTTLVDLPAFSWLISTVLPALVFAIPVIFAPEIRRALERVGRAGNVSFLNRSRTASEAAAQRHPRRRDPGLQSPLRTPPRRTDHPPADAGVG